MDGEFKLLFNNEEIGKIHRLNLKPGDTLVIRANSEVLSDEDSARIHKMIQDVMPGVPVVVIDSQIDIGVVSQAKSTSGQ